MKQVTEMNWLLSHYNLICYGLAEETVFLSRSGTGCFLRSRLFEHTDDNLVDQYKDDLAGLAELPALIVAEAIPNGFTRTPAFFSRIDNVREVSGEIRFEFQHLYGCISSEEIFGWKGLRFNRREHSRNHWAIKEGNLVESILGYVEHKSKKSSPKFFSVTEWPLPSLGHVAVMMPFRTDFDAVHETIKAACGDLNLETRRVDEIYAPAKIVDDVFSTIVQSRLVVSDLTGRNPNVLYETGLAHALDRDVVTIVQDDEDVPFDLNHIRFIKYLPNTEGLKRLRMNLQNSLREVLRPQR